MWTPAGSVCVPLTVLPFSYVPKSLSAHAPAGDPPREYTTPKESAFERAFAVNASAAEAGRFAYGVEAGNRLAVGRSQCAAAQIRLDSSEAFARQDELADRNQRAGLGIENALEIAGAN